ncbi:hypothetical protein OG709_29880 [Streptomyces sp. NBC_01267]|uniref:hypothetical protein n=1 Tax=Streptomyces sp. NBC_01267 TaxID=2903805 RepID=UPI002E31B256|nr:hypothetical protein [Streptomyces sp. NBC_01267]
MSVAVNLLSANVSGMETDANGWTAGTNTTRTRSTTRWYAGAASLLLTATAAGSVTATTTARVAVTGSTVYMAYAYFQGAPALAGQTSQVRIDFYAGATGGTALASATSAAAPMPVSSAWQTPCPIVMATSPSNALYASITVTASGVGAGSSTAVDVVSFGIPYVITNNLIDYNTQGCEVDTSGWRAQTNCIVGRTSALSYEGWWSQTITAVAAGNTESRTVSTWPVTEGTEYTAFAWVQAPAASMEFRTQILWYDASGAGIGSRSTYSWYPAATTWTRCAVIATAPAGAVSARVALSPQATAAGQTWTVDQVGFTVAPVTAGNLLTFRDQSFETDVSGWTATAGCSITRSTAQQWDGQGSMRITGTGTGDAVVMLASPLPVTARQAYRISPHVYHASTTPAMVVDMSFTWLDADGSIVSASYYRWNTATAAGWYSLTGSAVAPAGAVTMQVGLRVLGMSAGATAYVDAITVTAGGVGVTADLIPGAYGARITMQGLTTDGFTYWGLYRMAPDGTMVAVRGPSGDLIQTPITGDLAVAEDYEAPLGVELVYYLWLYTRPTVRTYASAPITLPAPTSTNIIIRDPGLPARWTTAVVESGGMPDWTRSARQGVNQVRGRARPIVISDVRASRTGTLTLVTETRDEVNTLWWLLDTGNTLLLQWPTAWGEADVYVQVGDVAETHVADYAPYQDRTWSIPLTEVDRPSGGITGSSNRTWDTVSTERSDWLGVLTGAQNWLDVYTGVVNS